MDLKVRKLDANQKTLRFSRRHLIVLPSSKVYMNVRTYVHTYVRTYVRMYAYTHVRTYVRNVRTYVRTYAPTYLHVCKYVRTYARAVRPFKCSTKCNKPGNHHLAVCFSAAEQPNGRLAVQPIFCFAVWPHYYCGLFHGVS